MFAHSPQAKYANKRQFLNAHLAKEARGHPLSVLSKREAQRLFPILSQFGQIIYLPAAGVKIQRMESRANLLRHKYLHILRALLAACIITTPQT
jgi:hypothetical protein